MTKDIYLYGASGHAKVIADIIEAMGLRVAGLLDDDETVCELLGHPVSHGYTGQSPLIISIGDNRIRKQLAERLTAQFATAIHPSAVVSPTASVGMGTVVMQGALIQSEARIGGHCIVNTGVSIDHECQIGDFAHISPHATLCGHVTVGEGTWIGAGTTVIQGVKVGRWAMIGAGSVVTKDIPDGWLAVGNPCRLIREINQDMLNHQTKMGGVIHTCRQNSSWSGCDYLTAA